MTSLVVVDNYISLYPFDSTLDTRRQCGIYQLAQNILGTVNGFNSFCCLFIGAGSFINDLIVIKGLALLALLEYNK